LTYDFMTLAPDDFESLVADLFSKEWGARLETFKVGKDQGIDLRHSRTLAGEPEAIVQCKRYRPDRFAALARALRDEQSNLRKLNPTRYVVATSVPLSDHQKDKLLELVSPWCRGKDDIYGASELNGLLRMHPDVVQAHFKLWISGTAILSRVLHAEVFALSEANRSGSACLNSIPRLLSGLRADCQRCSVVHGGGRRLRRTDRRGGQRGAHQGFASYAAVINCGSPAKYASSGVNRSMRE
jgi:hypothetical protein